MGTARVLSLPGASAIGVEGRTAAEDFRLLYSATARPLWAYLKVGCGDAALAEDLLQESFLRLIAAELPGIDDGGRRAYLFRIAGNLLRDHWRRHRRQPAAAPLDDDDLGVTATSQLAPSAAHAGLDLRRALARLTPRDRQLLWLAHVEGLSHREVAQALGLVAASVRVLLFRARRRLAAQLDVTGAGATP